MAAVAAALVGLLRSSPVAEARLVRITGDGVKQVTIEFQRCAPAARFAGREKVQVHRHGEWLPPQDLFCDRLPLFARTNYEQVDFCVPAEADACRFLLKYREGPNRYCQAFAFLQKYGIYERFPGISKSALKFIPSQQKPRDFSVEIALK